jgi:Flp pilus assembly protein protease CpaA
MVMGGGDVIVVTVVVAAVVAPVVLVATVVVVVVVVGSAYAMVKATLHVLEYSAYDVVQQPPLLSSDPQNERCRLASPTALSSGQSSVEPPKWLWS